jgi:hypothetical protein
MKEKFYMKFSRLVPISVCFIDVIESCVTPQFEFKLPPPKQTQEELFGSFVVHGW